MQMYEFTDKPTRKQFKGKVMDLIKQNTLILPDSECRIWVGDMHKGHRLPIVRTRYGIERAAHTRVIWVKRWLAPLGESPKGYMPSHTTTCGVGRRCVTPAHQVLVRLTPHAEWKAEGASRWLARHRITPEVSEAPVKAGMT